jgi:exopolyphosphatase/guanosine-5'-triphosphate,3'-diphosphate pyrophosphatase
MPSACIDIGSNTTRLLVAERDPARPTGVRALAAERAFTAIGAAAAADGTLPAAKIAEVASVVAAQAASARRHGAEQIRAVATAAIRNAPNRAALAAALARLGIELDVLSGEQEARLAFAGAIASLPTAPSGSVVVIDVGGGSTEIAVGRAGADPEWWSSLPVGSSSMTGVCVRHDPPSAACLALLRDAARDAFAAISPPPVALALAVGGSATSLAFLAGGAGDPQAWLDAAMLDRARAALTLESVAATALRLGLDTERVRVLPAGITLLARASSVFATPLVIARGGLREGVILGLLGRP